ATDAWLQTVMGYAECRTKINFMTMQKHHQHKNALGRSLSISLSFSVCLILILSWCARNENIINAPEDVAVAKELASNSYNDLDKSDATKISGYMDSKLDKTAVIKGIIGLVKKGGQGIKVDV